VTGTRNCALVERGNSPAQAKRVQSIEQKAADARRLSFRNFAQRWVDETLFYRSGGYRAQTVRWLDAYVMEPFQLREQLHAR
jgi:hypothetical protein